MGCEGAREDDFLGLFVLSWVQEIGAKKVAEKRNVKGEEKEAKRSAAGEIKV